MSGRQPGSCRGRGDKFRAARHAALKSEAASTVAYEPGSTERDNVAASADSK